MDSRVHRRRRTDRQVLIMYMWMLGLSVALTVTLALVFHNQKAADQRSKQSCERSLLYAPTLAKAYAQHHFLTGAQLNSYRSTIPRSC